MKQQSVESEISHNKKIVSTSFIIPHFFLENNHLLFLIQYQVILKIKKIKTLKDKYNIQI